MPQSVTGDIYTSFLGIIFYPFLNAAYRDSLSFIGSFLHQEDLLGPIVGTELQVGGQSIIRIRADVNYAPFAAFSLLNNEPATFEIKGAKV